MSATATRRRDRLRMAQPSKFVWEDGDVEIGPKPKGSRISTPLAKKFANRFKA